MALAYVAALVHAERCDSTVFALATPCLGYGVGCDHDRRPGPMVAWAAAEVVAA